MNNIMNSMKPTRVIGNDYASDSDLGFLASA